MPYDRDRYNRLIEQTVFNISAYTGSYQDISRNKLRMSVTGNIILSRINGLPAVTRGSDVGALLVSSAVSQILDHTASFACEAVIRPHVYTTDVPFLISHTASGGSGFWFYWHGSSSNKHCVIRLFNSTGSAFKTFATPTGSVLTHRTTHVIINSINGGTSSLGWINGAPVTMTTTVGSGVLAPFSATVQSMSNRSLISALLIRAYPFSLTNEDVAALYGAARELTGGEV